MDGGAEEIEAGDWSGASLDGCIVRLKVMGLDLAWRAWPNGARAARGVGSALG